SRRGQAFSRRDPLEFGAQRRAEARRQPRRAGPTQPWASKMYRLQCRATPGLPTWGEGARSAGGRERFGGQKRSDSRAPSEAAGNLQRAADLLHALAHSKDAKVACRGETQGNRLKATAIVTNFDASGSRAELHANRDQRGRRMGDGVADRFAGDQQ